jgi:hypothetical protein
VVGKLPETCQGFKWLYDSSRRSLSARIVCLRTHDSAHPHECCLENCEEEKKRHFQEMDSSWSIKHYSIIIL